jgi:hypothetical protein
MAIRLTRANESDGKHRLDMDALRPSEPNCESSARPSSGRLVTTTGSRHDAAAAREISKSRPSGAAALAGAMRLVKRSLLSDGAALRAVISRFIEDRKRETESAPLTDCAFCPNASAMPLHNALGNIETESHPSPVVGDL